MSRSPRCLITLFVALLCAGCSDSQSPEAQVRATIEAMELAAEDRSTGDLMEHVSTQFRDGYGRDADELSRYVRGYFIANQSVHLLTRIGEIRFPTREEARAQVTVAMVGRDAAEASAWNLAAEVHDFEQRTLAFTVGKERQRILCEIVGRVDRHKDANLG